MPTDVLIHLNELHCLAERDGSGHSEPYFWPVLLWVDDATLTSGELVGSSAPGIFAARLVVKEGMQPGDVAPPHGLLQTFTHQFEDGARRNYALVVAMFEHDETPLDAVRAGYKAFVEAVPVAVRDFALSHGRAPESEEEQAEVAAAIRPKVESAVRDALTWRQTFQVAVGSLDLDDEIGFSTVQGSVGDGDKEFTLVFATTSDRYELKGEVEVRQPPLPDLCQGAVDALKDARAALDSLESRAQRLQAQLKTASPAQKGAIIAEIRRIKEEEVPPALARVEAAQRALDLCRVRTGAGGGIFEGGGSVGGGVVG